MFIITNKNIDTIAEIKNLKNTKAGALVTFEGWVREQNIGKNVSSLEYQIYHELALFEGHKILAEAKVKFDLIDIKAVHREGHLQLGDKAVWIAATAKHRDSAFKATRYVIDEIKLRLPIWKKEYYLDEQPSWVFCKDHHHHCQHHEKEYYQKQRSIVDQDKLIKSKVLVVGAGGLGCPVLVSLATAGVGNITIIDFDTIALSNIHRQFLYSPDLVGEYKAIQAKIFLEKLNPHIKITSLCKHIAEEDIIPFDLVLDCTDNLKTKYLLHDWCFKNNKTLILGSVYKSQGMIRTFKPKSAFGCLRCFTQSTPQDSLIGNCNDHGVLCATTQYFGALQANEAIQFLQFGENQSLKNTLYHDLDFFDQMKIKNSQNTNCAFCHGNIEIFIEDVEMKKSELDLSKMQLIDIRTLSDDEVLQLDSAPKKSILFCHRGIRSYGLVRKLRANGHKDFYSLEGGACSL